jgi:hypothetical protein
LCIMVFIEKLQFGSMLIMKTKDKKHLGRFRLSITSHLGTHSPKCIVRIYKQEDFVPCVDDM